MAKTKKPLEWITDGSLRRSTLAKKKDSLVKSAQTLSALCGVTIAIAMYSHDEGFFSTWPDPLTMDEMLKNFFSLPEITRCQKMVSHESFLTDMIAKETNKRENAKKENDKAELNELMYQVSEGKGIHELDILQLTKLYNLAGEKIEEIEKREKHEKSKKMISSIPESMDCFENDQWFMNWMEFGASTSGSKNEEELPLDLSSFFPDIYFQ